MDYHDKVLRFVSQRIKFEDSAFECSEHGILKFMVEYQIKLRPLEIYVPVSCHLRCIGTPRGHPETLQFEFFVR